MQQVEKALIFDCSVENEAHGMTLFCFAYLIGDKPYRKEFYLEHCDYDQQARGQKAFAVLCRGCDLREPVGDSSDLLEREFHPQVIEEIDAILDGLKKQTSGAKTRGESTNSASTTSFKIDSGKYVYVVSCLNSVNPLCKIGIASSPKSRLRSLSTSSPHTLRLEMARYFESAREVEARAHTHFAGQRRNGEWFELPSSEAIAFLNSISISEAS